MKASEEINKAVSNIQYYAKQISISARKQLNDDVTLGNQVGVNVNAGTIRFDSLAAADAAANWIEIYCENILANVKSAESQDKLLYKPDEEENVQ